MGTGKDMRGYDRGELETVCFFSSSSSYFSCCLFVVVVVFAADVSRLRRGRGENRKTWCCSLGFYPHTEVDEV